MFFNAVVLSIRLWHQRPSHKRDSQARLLKRKIVAEANTYVHEWAYAIFFASRGYFLADLKYPTVKVVTGSLESFLCEISYIF